MGRHLHKYTELGLDNIWVARIFTGGEVRCAVSIPLAFCSAADVLTHKRGYYNSLHPLVLKVLDNLLST